MVLSFYILVNISCHHIIDSNPYFIAAGAAGHGGDSGGRAGLPHETTDATQQNAHTVTKCQCIPSVKHMLMKCSCILRFKKLHRPIILMHMV